VATEVIRADADQAGASIEHRGGIVDRLLAFIDRLPGPAAAWWLAVGIVLAVVGHLFVWTNPARPIGTISDDVIAPALIFAWFAWLGHTLNKVGTWAFNEFRPALGDPAAEDGYRLQLTTLPDRYAVIGAVVAVAVVSFAYYVGVRPFRESVPADVDYVSAPLWGLASLALGIVVMHTIRQLRLVSRLSAVARNVDIFKPGPINSFARLTAVSAIGLIAFVVAFMLYSPEQPIAYVIQESAVLVIAAASFVLPLRVMHNRLVDEKARLMADSQDRLKVVLSRVHDAVDQDDLGRAEQLRQTLTAVLAERDVLAKLHTWPWSAGTFRGFASALILPIALILFTQVIDRVI